MERRFEVRKKELVERAEIQAQVYEGLLDRLPEFLEPYLASLGRREPKELLRIYLQGLLSNLERKNIEAIAYLHDRDRRALQRFIGQAAWAWEPMLAELTRQAGADLGEADGVIVIDPSGFEKDGSDSAGVARQWLGRFGKIDNGQVGVYLGYATRKGQALCDLRLYLPKAWAADRARRRRCGVPKAVRFQTRHQLAQVLLEERGPCLPHGWVAGDDELGRSTRFRAWLRDRGERYLLAVPENTSVRDLEAEPPLWSGRGAKPKAPWRTARTWRETVPEAAWTRIDVRDGEKGPLAVEAVLRRVQTREEKRIVGPEEWLLVTRVKEANGWKIDYYLSNAPGGTPLSEFCRVAKAEHRIEDALKRAKSEAGLADYEVRTWTGWHHHQTLSLLATWFLTREAQRGEKVDAGDHRAADAVACGPVAA